MNEVNAYFLGERAQCLMGIILSIFSIGWALYFLWQLKTDFYKGMAWPLIIISILLFMICVGVVWRTSRDIERVSHFINHDKEKVALEEVPRMDKVLQNFEIIKKVELGLLLIGLGLLIFGFFQGNSFIKGIGLGLLLQSVIMYGFDYFAHERGKIYFHFLQNFKI